MVNVMTSRDRDDDTCCKKREEEFLEDFDEKCVLHRDILMKNGGGDAMASGAVQFGSSAVRKWDRAVGVILENAVVLAAHRLEMLPGLNGTLVCAMTGEPESALKVKQALAGKIKELEEEGSQGLTGEKAAQLVHKFSKQIRNVGEIEFLALGRDWDESRRDYVPRLSYAFERGSRNLRLSYCTGLGSEYSQMIVDNLSQDDMSIEVEVAVDIALRAIYCAAFRQNVEGQAVESVDVCVVTSKGITQMRHDIKDLHAKYSPMFEQMKQKFRRVAPPRMFTVPNVSEGVVYY